ncbi:hypothetical protein [Mycobacteroides abscessus]|uniref:hypothetical protein n=1 Tax=Mycobacteroides abscessus TaxID=36809 RepID=UPI00092C1231|nr:hypothetical protein [Mycobacteroides abscessus]MDM2399843.1 hypothetical protein [Mycobacteroides abscessus]MDM2410739.1 hypothetical protein [Mycobacteroides abscessus]SII69029.1 Uncharacterised protein [Mycobacteroides abscessus subsp. abscessus]
MTRILPIGAISAALIIVSACTSVVEGEAKTDGSPGLPNGDPESLLLPREDFPAGAGTYEVLKQPGDDGPSVSPVECNIFVNHDTVPFEQAAAQYEDGAIRVDVVVGKGITDSFSALEEKAGRCKSVTLDLDGVEGTGSVKMGKASGATVDTTESVFSGGLGLGGEQTVEITIKTLTAHPRGATVTVKVLRAMEPWSSDDDKLALTLLNKQVVKVQNAP